MNQKTSTEPTVQQRLDAESRLHIVIFLATLVVLFGVMGAIWYGHRDDCAVNRDHSAVRCDKPSGNAR